MGGTLVQITDAIAADLNLLALPSHNTWKYVEPKALRMDKGLWLAVFPSVVDYQLVATDSSYSNDQTVTVWWAEPAFEQADTGTKDQELAKSCLDRAELVHLRMMGYADGVPGLDQVWARMVRADFGLPTVDTSWRAEFVLRVEEFEL